LDEYLISEKLYAVVTIFETDVFDKLNIFGVKEYVCCEAPLFLRTCNMNPSGTPVVGKLNVTFKPNPVIPIKFGTFELVYVYVPAVVIVVSL
jgi:hypothetical protein